MTTQSSTPVQYSGSVCESRRMRAEALLRQEIAFIHNSSFGEEHAEYEILGDPSTWLQQQEKVIRTNQSLPVSTSLLPLPTDMPLLTAEEEAHYFRLMNYLKYQANVLRSGLNPTCPSEDDMNRIDLLLEWANLVRDFIVLSNLRLVLSIARHFSSSKYNFEDMVSDGYFILIRAVEKFDYDRGYRFSTYATHAIQRDIFRQFRKKGTEAERYQAYSEDQSEELKSSDTFLEEQLQENQQFQVYQDILELIESELNDRERFILKSRFGLNPSQEPQKLRVIAEELGLSKERIRQLQKKAIEKLQDKVPWDALF